MMQARQIEDRRGAAAHAPLPGLSDEQFDMLRQLDRFGWDLRFVRRGRDGRAIAVVHDPDRHAHVAVTADGRLDRDTPLSVRR